MGDIISDCQSIRPSTAIVLTNTQVGFNYYYYYYSILLPHRAITVKVLSRTHIRYMFRHDRTVLS